MKYQQIAGMSWSCVQSVLLRGAATLEQQLRASGSAARAKNLFSVSSESRVLMLTQTSNPEP